MRFRRGSNPRTDDGGGSGIRRSKQHQIVTAKQLQPAKAVQHGKSPQADGYRARTRNREWVTGSGTDSNGCLAGGQGACGYRQGYRNSAGRALSQSEPHHRRTGCARDSTYTLQFHRQREWSTGVVYQSRDSPNTQALKYPCGQGRQPIIAQTQVTVEGQARKHLRGQGRQSIIAQIQVTTESQARKPPRG